MAARGLAPEALSEHKEICKQSVRPADQLLQVSGVAVLLANTLSPAAAAAPTPPRAATTALASARRSPSRRRWTRPAARTEPLQHPSSPLRSPPVIILNAEFIILNEKVHDCANAPPTKHSLDAYPRYPINACFGEYLQWDYTPAASSHCWWYQESSFECKFIILDAQFIILNTWYRSSGG